MHYRTVLKVETVLKIGLQSATTLLQKITRRRSESAHIRQLNYYSPQILVRVLPARPQVRILYVAAAATVQRNGHFGVTLVTFLYISHKPPLPS